MALPGGYFQQLALNGQCFFGSTTNAGVAVPAYNATAQVFGLWNPAGSGVYLVLNKIQLGIATLGTNIVGAIGFSYLLNTGSQIATGSPITAFTATTPFNVLVGAGQSSQAKFTLAATTTAPAFLYSIGATSTTGTPTDSTPVLEHDFNGALIIPQGVYIGLGASAAPGSTYQATLSWAEVPV